MVYQVMQIDYVDPIWILFAQFYEELSVIFVIIEIFVEVDEIFIPSFPVMVFIRAECRL